MTSPSHKPAKLVHKSAEPAGDISADPIAGFSLAEILVVLSILALITGMTTVFLGQLRKASQIHSEREMQYDLDSVSRYLERTIESALALPLDISENKDRAFFRGSHTVIEFVSTSRVGIQEAAMRTKRIEMAENGDANDLVQTLSTRRFHGSTSTGDEPVSATILDDVKEIRFEYFGAPFASQKPQWSPDWNHERSLPRAVRMTVTAIRNGHEFTSEGIAQIRNATK
ncbi:type II secretion system protein GspJ [Hoeflea poritis]|uniref:Type II secretion system protein J n=1 Tax=Hoeflea poritis TaxID=2993659 RepID=A0ABT4VXA0_9HYPH|nr:type II secretion system protein GspJ [Hoeflea poritis]MDA4848835.1 prepilin-type N-terminal cleavage/methylation domain-containing protein [Hoeflea poritis]